jgi:uncharacterized membrane protein YfcA
MSNSRNPFAVFAAGALVGTLGGLIGLGGAEFRLPLLIGLFGFAPLSAVILNKAMSLAVVAVSLPFRAASVPFASVFARWDVIATLLTGSLVGAWLGAGWTTRLASRTLYRVLALLLAFIAVILIVGHNQRASPAPLCSGTLLAIVGVTAGFGIGVVSALMGVAGGELLIPTILLLFGADIKLAGSLSLAVSIPTMITAFTRYSHDQSFVVLRIERRFVLVMVLGSLVGAFLGSRLLGVVPPSVLFPLLAVILIISAVKVWKHA